MESLYHSTRLDCPTDGGSDYAQIHRPHLAARSRPIQYTTDRSVSWAITDNLVRSFILHLTTLLPIIS